jgi:alpha-glucoside transport system substrate-binding protein
MKRHKLFWKALMLLVVMVMVAACGTPSPTPAPEDGGEMEPTATEEPAGPGEDTGTVFILGPFRGSEETAFNEVIAVFEEQNPDIDVIYSGTAEFETLINVRVEAGDAPDIAAFPQPGAVQRFAEQGELVPLWDEALTLYDEQYSPAWKDLSSIDGTPYGMFHRVNAKGWVWYNKPMWNEAGWEVPTTYDEFMDLIAQMQEESDIAPMCDAIESGEATGWKGTDWIENFVLRLHPIDVYDSWVAHELEFSSDEIKAAWERLGTLWFDDTITYGGRQTIASTNFREPAAWLFEDPPNCWMHMQGSFVTNFFPQSVQDNLDEQVGVFQLPPIREDLPVTLEVGGDQYVVFKGHERDEVKKFIEFLATPESVQPWAEGGGALFPHQNQSLDWYPTELERNMAESILQAEAARFDGSDNMNSEVNLAFWQGITDWVSGNRTLDEALADIDESLP